MTGDGDAIRPDAAGRSPSGALRSSWRSRGLRLLPSALLSGVACHQILLASTVGLAPWSGGGFGMFASTDAGGTRHLHAFVRRAGIRREVEPPAAAEDLVRRALTLPSDARLRALAALLAEQPAPDHGPARSVEIQVWHTHFAPDSLLPEGRILRGIEVPLGGD